MLFSYRSHKQLPWHFCERRAHATAGQRPRRRGSLPPELASARACGRTPCARAQCLAAADLQPVRRRVCERRQTGRSGRAISSAFGVSRPCSPVFAGISGIRLPCSRIVAGHAPIGRGRRSNDHGCGCVRAAGRVSDRHHPRRDRAHAPGPIMRSRNGGGQRQSTCMSSVASLSSNSVLMCSCLAATSAARPPCCFQP